MPARYNPNAGIIDACTKSVKEACIQVPNGIG